MPAFSHRSFFLHVLINEQLPELFITHRHKISPPYRYTKNALQLGRAFGLLQPYCQGLFQHMTALFIMIAYLVRESKKMIDPHEFRLRQISFCSVKGTVEPLSSQSYNREGKILYPRVRRKPCGFLISPSKATRLEYDFVTRVAESEFYLQKANA